MARDPDPWAALDSLSHPEPRWRRWRRRLVPALALAGTAASAAGFAASLTTAYTGMRDVMRSSGGFCARGGPYEIANQCTPGQVRMLLIGIAGMFVCGGLLLAFTAWIDGPVLASGLAMWSALFGALGFNFVDLAARPSRGHGSVSGWIVSGVAFWAMAAAGLVVLGVLAVGWLRRRGQPEPPPFSGAPIVRAQIPPGGGAVSQRPEPPPERPAGPSRLVLPTRRRS